MSNSKMLIDAAHPEETRVAVIRGNRVEEYDFESEHKSQIRGNIYLAKVTRVEPSLQAAFVEYGGNRHGFLAFSEIHPDYYQIPIADRQALLAAEAEEARQAAIDDDDAGDVEAAEADNDDDGAEAVEAEPKPRKRRSSRRRKAPAAKADAADGDDASNAATEENDDSADEMSAENENDDVVSESADASGEPDAKPKRRTVRRKAPVAPKKESEDQPADATSSEAASTGAEKPQADDAQAEEKPKPKTRRRSAAAKKKEAEASEAETASEKSDEPAKADDDADAVPEKPKRKRASRAKKAVKDDDGSTAEASDDKAQKTAADDADADDGEPKKKPRARRSRRKSVEEPELETVEAEGEDASVEETGSGDDALEEAPARRAPRKHYKIQEVIKRRQILLVQVTKEERGNKGAALTTYLSLAGRYSVLMPNTARGGGISRKITNAPDRKRLKSIAGKLDVPNGMGVILRTAGASRDADEIERDFDYLMRLWENVRTLTLESQAPCLVYEEGSLIKRSIRDLYDTDTSEILVAGEQGYKEAHDFMSMLMPDHARKVKLYTDRIPLFARMGVEAQLDAMLQPQVTLKSGGYIIIDQTEALVAIDVNSGRSTRQHSVEETAVKTNLEAADEIARQLRLRDLAGLIVVDFIDMDERRNNRSVEKRLKDALKNDRARIQLGRISHFGLMEMSRQRMRASVLESTTQTCPVCEGLGHVRAGSSIALAVLRSIEEQLNKSARNDLIVKVSTSTAIYLLNHKRLNLSDLEQRFGVTLHIETDDTLGTTPCSIEQGEPASGRSDDTTVIRPDDSMMIDGASDGEETAPAEAETTARETRDPDAETEGDGRKRRRRRRRKRGSGEGEAANEGDSAPAEAHAQTSPDANETSGDDAGPPPRSRRSRRKPSSDNGGGEQTAKPDDTGPADANAAEADDAKAEPQKRSSTRRRKAPVAAANASDGTAETTEAEPPAQAGADDAEAKPDDAPKRSTRRKSVREVIGALQFDKGEKSEAKAADGSGEAPEKKSGKSGWWSGKFF